MIARAEADRLRALRSSGTPVVSLYLPVPLDLADHRGLATRARELVRAAAAEASDRGLPAPDEQDVESLAALVGTHSHEWLGRTVALFACAGIGLSQTAALPGPAAGRAVVARRPYLRPLLAAMQRSPAYRVAVIDARHAWVLAISDGRIETLAERIGEGVPSTGFAGWYGLESYRVQQRVMQLARQHFRQTFAILDRPGTERLPLVIGGQEAEVSQFLAAAPRGVSDAVAGTFRVDLQTVTPGRIRELAGPVIEQWTRQAEAAVVADVLGQPPNRAVTTGLDGCLAAIRSGAVGQLIVADEKFVPGFGCGHCGALSTRQDRCDCPDPAEPCQPVPDLLDEMACRALDGGAEVTAVRGAPFEVAARLRFPVTAGSAG